MYCGSRSATLSQVTNTSYPDFQVGWKQQQKASDKTGIDQVDGQDQINQANHKVYF